MKIGILGFGNLGTAFATGLVKQGVDQASLLVCEKSECAVKRAHTLGINTTDYNSLVKNCDIIVLSVKPDVLTTLPIQKDDFMGKTIISFVVGVNLEKLQQMFGCAVARCVPTIAMENLKSITGLCFDEYVTDRDYITDLFKKLGIVYITNEEGLNKIVAIASSGLGFAAYILDCFTKAGERLGFSEQEAIDIVSQTFAAAIEIGNYENLTNRVGTKGGITQRGIEMMNEGSVGKTIDGTMKIACQLAATENKR